MEGAEPKVISDEIADEKLGKKAKPRFSWFEFKSTSELEGDEDAQYTDDCYSFLALGCGEDNRIPFAYGLVVFAMQIAFLILMICSKVNRNMSANEDIDNPDEDSGGFSEYMPSNASLVVRTTQFVSIIAFVIFAEDSIADVADAVRYFPLPIWSTDHIFVSMACCMRFAQGVLACFTVFLLVMTSEDVIDIVLNFTAVNFISGMDDAAFELAKSGRYGDTLKKKALAIEGEDGDGTGIKVQHNCLLLLKDKKVILKDEEGEETEDEIDISSKWYLPVITVISVLLLGFSIYVAAAQQAEDRWEADIFRVEFDDETGLLEYSGCFDKIGRNGDRRGVYKSQNHSQQEPALIEYCKLKRRWILYQDTGNESINGCDTGEYGLSQSTKTNAFSISTAFELNWLSQFRKPLEMYFIEGDNDEDLFCTQFANDGRCDDLLNNFDYKFDGGDCCGTTCSHGNCGTDGVFEAFDQKLTKMDGAIGYPSCIDPEMEDISVNLTMIEFQDTSDLDVWKKFWRPTLELECGGREKSLVFSIPVSQSMFGNSYDGIKVPSETDCDLTADNFEPIFGSAFAVDELLSVDGIESVNLLSKSSIPTEFGLLEGQTSMVYDGKSLEGTIPTEIGSLQSLKEINLANNDLSGTVPKAIGSLRNLTSLILDNNMITGTIPLEMTSLLDMTALILSNNALKGTLPSQIGLLTKLTYLDLRNNQLTGLVPAEAIESLPNLQYLYLNENSLKGSVNCKNMPNIWDEELCQATNAFPRWDSESPTVSPAPSSSPTISAAPTVTPQPTVSPQPTSWRDMVKTESPTSSPTDPPPKCRSIAEILCEENEFASMCNLMMASGDAENILSSFNSTWTIFAPTNAGFTRYYTDNGVQFNFEEVFWFHAVEDEELFEDDLPCTTGLNLVEMSNGKDSRTLCDRRGNPLGQKGAGNAVPIPFIAFDMPACNGVIHTISDVLLALEI